MQRDLVHRLRWPPISGPDDNPISVTLRIEAADEIEKLRAALLKVRAEVDLRSAPKLTAAIDEALGPLAHGQ